MSQAYYYFVASLPSLTWDGPLPMPAETFLEQTELLLASEDHAAVQAVLTDAPAAGRHPWLDQWQEFEAQIRYEAVWVRAGELNRDAQTYLRGERRTASPEIVDALALALESPDPLEGERVIDRLRWRRWEELAQGHYFDLDWILSYAACLKILDRYQRLASPRGGEIGERYEAEARETARTALAGREAM